MAKSMFGAASMVIGRCRQSIGTKQRPAFGPIEDKVSARGSFSGRAGIDMIRGRASRPRPNPLTSRISPAGVSLFAERRPAMKIYGDTNSGNCLKVKWVCDALALPYSWIDVDTQQARNPHLAVSQAEQRGAGARRSSSTTAGCWRNPTPSSATSLAAAISSRRMALRRQRWTNGCSGNNTATSPMSRSAATRWSISASRRPTSIPTRSSAAMRRWRGWSISSPRRGFWSAPPCRSPTSRCWPIQGLRMRAAFTSTAMPPCGAGSAKRNNSLLPPAR